MTADKVGELEAWAMYALAQAEYERMLRIYRAWQGAAVGRKFQDGNDAGDWIVTPDADDPDAPNEYQRVRLVPDGGQGA